MSDQKTWEITRASGAGSTVAKALLKQGDRVIAPVRSKAEEVSAFTKLDTNITNLDKSLPQSERIFVQPKKRT